MKWLKIILPFLFFSQLALAQNDVFVLVDISKSIYKSDLENARQALSDVLVGNPLSNATVSFGSAADLSKFKLITGDKLYIIKFGDKSTTLNPYAPPCVIHNIPADITQQLDAFFPTTPTDSKTYLTLAKAKVVEFAKNNKIGIYKLYLITDNITDDYGPNGKPDFTQYERDLTQSVGTGSNPILIAPSVKLRLNDLRNKDYALEFIPSVNVVNVVIPQQPPVINQPVASSNVAQIKMTTNAGGRKNKEIELKDDNLGISWSCSNYPAGGTYTVVVSSYEGEKYKEIRKDQATGFSLKLPDGKFKVMVMAENFKAISATTYVEVSTGGSLWFLWLILIAGILFAVYKWLKKKQNNKNMTPSRRSDIYTKKGPDNSNSPGSFDF